MDLSLLTVKSRMLLSFQKSHPSQPLPQFLPGLSFKSFEEWIQRSKRSWEMGSKFWFKVLLMCLVVLTLSLPACSLFDTGETALSPEQLAQTAIAETVAVEQQVQTVVAQTLAVSGVKDTDQPEATLVPEPTILKRLNQPSPLQRPSP
jgi:hypothetical protein